MTNPRAAIYARISLDDSADGLGVSRQEIDCRAYCDRRGWTVQVVFTDNDVSASRYGRKPRPGWRALMEAVAAGQVDRVVVWDLDRLVRQPRELEDLIDLCERHAAGVEVHNLHGDLNLRTADGRAMARILVAMAAKESDNTSRRQQRKKAELAERGMWHGGRPPFGYRRADTGGLEVDPVEADFVEWAAAHVLDGGSVRQVVAELERRGLPSRGGGRWDGKQVRRMLLGPATFGQRVHRGVVVGPAAWPAILDVTLRADIAAALARPSPPEGQSERRYLLSGLVRCGVCGARMYPRMHQGGRWRGGRYACLADRGGCNRNGIAAEPVDSMVGEVLAHVLAGFRDSAPAVDDGGVADAVAADEVVLAQLARDHYVDGLIGRDEYLTARRAVEARLTENRRRLTRVRSVPGRSLGELWVSARMVDRCEVARTLISRVTIGPSVPGRRFDPTRVHVTWWADHDPVDG